ncbi:preprotein translocase subunit TatB [Loktanella sp. 5RATIMAR09]|uniref:Sec-independent protein translocase protein TatB n=1 Tax=Loktanella sp. 5RATIMAR09 TaxID=1225655 RepID=UPI0006EB55E7|nr:Sec-independent protein translocase protein TatB [Loktanella sp. 5RATIMAR09]KQI73048.1 preprotein translocase subunit TatB [Loktanella sp. 5RATIMAR09]
MFGLGWSELLVVGIVALIVIGPKDLPGLFRTIGQFTGKARMMAREFSRAMEQAADDSGVKDISKTLNAAANPKKFGVDKIKEATGVTETPLSPERQAAKEKVSKAMGDAALARQAREAEEAAAKAKATADGPKPETPAPEAKT